MKKEELIKLGISEEIADKVVEMADNELKGYIPKTRFDEVNNAKKTAENEISKRDKQIEELKAVSGASDELKKTIERLENENKTAQAEYEKSIKELHRNSIDSELLNLLGAKNSKAVLALLDKLDDGLNDDGYKTMRKQQLETLKASEDTSFLFKSEESQNQNNINIKGANPATGNHDTSGSGKPDSEKSYEDFCNESQN